MRSLARLAALAGVIPVAALGQLQLFVVEGGVERPAGSLVDVGATAAGDTLTTVFRVRNAGTATSTVQTITVAGAGFRLGDVPVLPAPVSPGGALDFSVRFSPPAFGSYSASLAVNALMVLLRGSASAAATVSVEQGGLEFVLSAGAVVPFGTVERGSTSTRRFKLTNDTPSALRVNSVGVTGPFSSAVQTPIDLAPRESVSFDVVFRPETAGPAAGTLTVDGRAFELRGTGVDPPFPAIRVVLDPASARSAQQVRVRVELQAPSRAPGSGEVRLDFQSQVPVGGEDAAIQFSSGGRTARFTVAEGESVARFGEATETQFQTGTTAGTITVSATLGASTDRPTLTIGAAAVTMSSVQAVRTGTGADVVIVGFDNSRTAGRLAFTFYSTAGAAIGSAVAADATADFRRYFETSLGGTFQLRAAFPVAGDASQIGAVEVEMTNSAGTARSERVRF